VATAEATGSRIHLLRLFGWTSWQPFEIGHSRASVISDSLCVTAMTPHISLLHPVCPGVTYCIDCSLNDADNSSASKYRIMKGEQCCGGKSRDIIRRKFWHLPVGELTKTTSILSKDSGSQGRDLNSGLQNMKLDWYPIGDWGWRNVGL
jgi:hypothetical protein